MNYLAHAYLSGNDPDLLVGNFIADHLRGGQTVQFSEGVREGIRLHREIDSYTDSHPAFRASKRLFYNGYERHSGILVDIYSDHLLARDFSLFSEEPLDEFSRRVYGVYEKARMILPESGERFLSYVLQNNIYQSYATPEGIERVLYHLSHRIRHDVRLDKSLGMFIENEQALKENFERLFTDLRSQFPAR